MAADGKLDFFCGRLKSQAGQVLIKDCRADRVEIGRPLLEVSFSSSFKSTSAIWSRSNSTDCSSKARRSVAKALKLGCAALMLPSPPVISDQAGLRAVEIFQRGLNSTMIAGERPPRRRREPDIFKNRNRFALDNLRLMPPVQSLNGGGKCVNLLVGEFHIKNQYPGM
jgi:hypothetical protein